MAARKPTPPAAADKAAVTPAPAAAAEEKAAQEKAEADAKAAEEKAAQEKAEADAKAAEEKAAQEKAAADASAAAKTTTDELECEVLEPLLHNGDKYKPGDFIYLTKADFTAKQAAGLVRIGTPVNDGDLA